MKKDGNKQPKKMNEKSPPQSVTIFFKKVPFSKKKHYLCDQLLEFIKISSYECSNKDHHNG